MSASLRCGFIAARPDWTQDLADLKIATNFGGGRMAADIVLRTLTDSGYRRHMESVRLRLAQEMKPQRSEADTVLEKLPIWITRDRPSKAASRGAAWVSRSHAHGHGADDLAAGRLGIEDAAGRANGQHAAHADLCSEGVHKLLAGPGRLA